VIGWPDAPSGRFGCGLFKFAPLERPQTEGARSIGRAYQTTLAKLQHCLLSNSDTMEAMRAVGIVCGSWANTGAAFRVVSSSLYRIWALA
jgi:hypothetical protein